MRFGPIQKAIISLLEENGQGAMYVSIAARSTHLQGYDIAQIKRSLKTLVLRGYVVRRGLCYQLAPGWNT